MTDPSSKLPGLPERIHLRKPSMDDFVFEGEKTPLLFQRRVIVLVIVGFAAIVGAYIAATQFFGLTTEIDADPFRNWVDSLGPIGPLAYIGLLALSVLFAPIPNAPIFVAAGLVWGPIIGTAYSMVGMLIGSVMAFYVSRWIGRKHLARLIGTKAAQHLDNIAETMGGKVIFWARMLPAVNFDLISFVAGVTSIRFGTFFIATAFGMLLPTAVGVIAGDGLGRDFRITLAAGGVWLAGIVLSALYFWWRRRKWIAQRRADAREMAAQATREADAA
jgi:uncharacterized membrane protein YdjX (TVP38/TMEM64 family)